MPRVLRLIYDWLALRHSLFFLTHSFHLSCCFPPFFAFSKYPSFHSGFFLSLLLSGYLRLFLSRPSIGLSVFQYSLRLWGVAAQYPTNQLSIENGCNLQFNYRMKPSFPESLFLVFLERVPVTFLPFRLFGTPSVAFTSVCFSSVCFLANFVLASSSKPSPRFLALLVIRLHRCFRDPLFALLFVGPALLFSFFPSSLYFSSPSSFRGLAFFVFLSTFAFPSSLSFSPWIIRGRPLHSHHIFPT